MRLSVDDIGFRQAVTVVERLRTYGGKPFEVSAHLDRWQHSLETCCILGVPTCEQVASLLRELITRNASVIQGEVGVTMFATPGLSDVADATFGLHLNHLDDARSARRCQHGQPLVVTEVMQPDEECWSRSIKVRSRLHYYRADLMARAEHLDAGGVLIDRDGTVTETSIANLAIVEAGRISSPPAFQVLRGVTQSVIEQLAAEASIPWQKERLTVERLSNADEVLLMGTDTGLWFSNRVNGRSIGSGQAGPIYRELQTRFQRRITLV